MEKIELAKAFADMVKKHEQEALEMVTKIGTSELTEDSKEVLYEVVRYATTAGTRTKLAQYYYRDVAEEFIRQGLED